jgi:putative DNA primase/helicase
MVELSSIYSLAKTHHFRFIPLKPRAKFPTIEDWVHKASDDYNTLQIWHMKNPDANWGLATGQASGVFVVDIDPKSGGDETWNSLIEKHGEPATVTVKTGSGGTHYYFQYPVNMVIGNYVSKLGKGIDIRGEGGQVVVPPSIHPNGTPYEWINSPETTEIASAPKWILDGLKTTSQEEYTPLGGELEKGSRNSSIYHQSLLLARSGATAELIFPAMRSWCNSTGNDDIPDQEIQDTIQSAIKKSKEDMDKKAKSLFGKTDDDNARRLLEEWKKDVVYVTGMGWFIWNGKQWKNDLDDAGILGCAIQTMRNLKDEALEEAKTQALFKEAMVKLSWANSSLNIGKLHAMIEIASKSYEIRKEPDDMDGELTKWLVNFKNGTLDLRTGELHPHDKANYITKLIPYNYNPDAKCPFWEETLHLALDGNEALIDFTHRALGYSLSGSTAEQCLFIAWGESGNNGKSTILETVQKIVGSGSAHGYAQMSDMKVITSNETDNRVASSLAKLQGARLVSMNEAEEHQKFSESLIKQLTGGDTVEACRKYKEPFEFKPVFKLWIRTNEKPVIRGTSDAIWRRIKLIPFNKPIPVEKRKSRDVVDEMLFREIEGIIAWLVQGFKLWYEGGLTSPEEVTAATEDYRTEMDLVGKFLEERTEHKDGKFTYRTALYQNFLDWLKINGYRYTYSSDNFGKRVARRLSQPASQRAKKNGQYVWSDLVITGDIDFDFSGSGKE